MIYNASRLVLLFYLTFFANQVSAENRIHAYFSNDSVNGLMLSDAYETHNMGLMYFTEQYYLKLDLGIVSPDMYVYRNEYREANRSFGELISLEVGMPDSSVDEFRFYARVRTTGKFGVDKFQDFAHRLLSLQQVNAVNDLIRMPADTWVGVGVRSDLRRDLWNMTDIELNLEAFTGSDTAFLNANLTKTFHKSPLTYGVSLGGRFVAFDQVISAPPIYAKERKVIPKVSFSISYDAGSYSVYLTDTFSLPSIKSDNDLYGVLSAGISYSF